MEISTPVAVLLGACVGAASSISGALLSHYLEFKRNREKWQFEKKVEAYSNSLRYLIRVKNAPTTITSKGQGILEKQYVSEWLNDLCEAQIWLSYLQIYCSKECQELLKKDLDTLNGKVSNFTNTYNSTTMSEYADAYSTEVLLFLELFQSAYNTIYICARKELNS